MNERLWLRPIAIALLALPALAAVGREITVFTAEGLPPIAKLELATDIQVMAPIDPLLERLRFAYPGSEAAARRRANRIFNAPEGQEVLAALKARANAAGLAWLAGIDYLPAVLVSPGYVVYGVYDLEDALAQVDAYEGYANDE